MKKIIDEYNSITSILRNEFGLIFDYLFKDYTSYWWCVDEDLKTVSVNPTVKNELFPHLKYSKKYVNTDKSYTGFVINGDITIFDNDKKVEIELINEK